NFIDDVIDIANDQIAIRPELAGTQFDATEDKWTLARLGADPIDPSRSLSEANIYAGELMAIREIGQPASPLLFDDVEELADTGGKADLPWTKWFVDNRQ
ncbi:EsaB/YukD family protein, partial [Mycobacteroides abscessus]